MVIALYYSLVILLSIIQNHSLFGRKVYKKHLNSIESHVPEFNLFENFITARTDFLQLSGKKAEKAK